MKVKGFKLRYLCKKIQKKNNVATTMQIYLVKLSEFK